MAIIEKKVYYLYNTKLKNLHRTVKIFKYYFIFG